MNIDPEVKKILDMKLVNGEITEEAYKERLLFLGNAGGIEIEKKNVSNKKEVVKNDSANKMPVQDKVNPWSLGDRLVSELKKKNLIAFLGVIFLMFCVLWLLISNFSNRNFETKKFAQRNKEIESKKAEEFEKKKAEEFEKKKAEKFEKEKRHIENEAKKKQKMMEACRDFIDELIVDQHKKAKKMFNDPEFLSELAQRECTLKEIKLDVEKSEISYFGGDTAKVYVKFKLDLSMKSDFSRETSHVYTTGTSIGKVIWNGSEAEKGEVVEYAED